MVNKNILMILMLVVFCSVSVQASITLPWSTTYDYAEWEWTPSTYHPPNYPEMDRGGDDSCEGHGEQFTTAANMAAGGGGRGQRHWVCDGSNQNSGGVNVQFAAAPELWIRWYMRYESGFAWNSLNYDKILFLLTDGTPNAQAVPEWKWSNDLAVPNQNTGSDVDIRWLGEGWQTVMGGAVSDGQWHCYEVYLKMDTDGTNGEVNFWIDGVAKGLKTGMKWSGTGGDTTGWTHIGIGSNQATPSNGRAMAVDFDDIAISTTGYIGPLSTTCPNSICDTGECNTCPGDCSFADCCPDGTCNNQETCLTCSQDCPSDADLDTYDSIVCGGTDCDDNNINIHPGAAEICDGVDNNCVLGIDENNGDCSGLMPYCVSGACVECIDNSDCTLPETCNSHVCSSGVNINFQPVEAEVPNGYLVDGGDIFGDRGNGYFYGWNVNNMNTRDRNNTISPDQRYDTLNHMEPHTWEIELENKEYNVKIVAGDSNNYLGHDYRINAESTLVVNGVPTDSNRWIEGTAAITVADGRLTLSNAGGSNGNRICFVEISSASSSCGSADTNSDSEVDILEIMAYITEWKAGTVDILDLMTGIGEWKNGC